MASHLRLLDVLPFEVSNHLYYGDNLTIMQTMPAGCVDLIYLDPPFNSQRNYNLIYKRLTGLPVPEQEEAFCDAWEMDAEKEHLLRTIRVEMRKYDVPDDVGAFWHTWLNALRNTQPRLLAYLVYMTYRLLEMKRVLKSTGSIYLHCDSVASHYIKVIMDGVFGHRNFKNEIIWQRTNARSTTGRLPRVHDVLLYYTKGERCTFNPAKVRADDRRMPHTLVTGSDGRKYQSYELTAPGRTKDGESGRPWRGFDPAAMGRHWANNAARMDEWDAKGLIHWPKDGGFPRRRGEEPFDPTTRVTTLGDVWTDIDRLNQTAKERLGYPTQKPIKLLSRIIALSSNPGDVVFDPFAGCGTAIYAAHLTGRKWIGCDIAILSVQIVRDVLSKTYGLREGEHYEVSGVPLSVEGAQELFEADPRQFQHWAVEKSGGFASLKHSGDRGIDGRIHYETKDGLRHMVLSVKGGKLQPAFVRELRGVLERETDATMGGLICLQPLTPGMRSEVAAAGMMEHEGVNYPRLQIRTIEDLLAGRLFETPSRVQTLGREQQPQLPMGSGTIGPAIASPHA